jgi:phosphate acetyltransferase
MTENPIDLLQGRAQADPQRVIYPEATEVRVVQAARRVADLGGARPILLGDPAEIPRIAADAGTDLSGIEVIDPAEPGLVDALVEQIPLLRPDLTEKTVRRKLQSPLNLAAALLAVGRADAMVAGLTYTTGDVVLAGRTFVGLEAGVSTPSSLFIMRVPGYQGSEGELFAFADCGVVVNPDATELADIAITTANTVQTLFGWQPKVAMLSYSTKGSGYDDSVEKVLEALALAQQRAPQLAIDGELQLDAAIVPDVAAQKVPEGSPVAGIANVLVFPDLNAGNIAYKSVQRFARADAFGPFLQGFAKTVSDLSRGSSVADIVGVTLMASVRAQG